MTIKAWFVEVGSFSMWRLFTGVILAIILSAASLSIAINSVIGYFSQSVVGSGMVTEFINLFGKRRVYNILNSPWPFYLKQLCFILLAMFYVSLLYKREKRRVFLKDLK